MLYCSWNQHNQTLKLRPIQLNHELQITVQLCKAEGAADQMCYGHFEVFMTQYVKSQVKNKSKNKPVIYRQV